jgi:hypothetical protein
VIVLPHAFGSDERFFCPLSEISSIDRELPITSAASALAALVVSRTGVQRPSWAAARCNDIPPRV